MSAVLKKINWVREKERNQKILKGKMKGKKERKKDKESNQKE